MDVLTASDLAELINLAREAWGNGVETRHQTAIRRKLKVMHLAKTAVDLAVRLDGPEAPVLPIMRARKAGDMD